MQLLRLRDEDQEQFDRVAEVAMGCHLGRSEQEFYLVVGGCIGIILDERTFSNPDQELFGQPWIRAVMNQEERLSSFNNWLRSRELAPQVAVANPAEAWPAFWTAFSPVTPRVPLPPPPPRPGSIYGHLPFTTTTGPNTIIYRWEAFPSRRIDRTTTPPTIAADTYASPASEVFFAPTGFGAVARFALPNLLPACFRWELQPISGTQLECGASVPLYGQSGGGVEVKFVALTVNRCAIADPIILPAL